MKRKKIDDEVVIDIERIKRSRGRNKIGELECIENNEGP